MGKGSMGGGSIRRGHGNVLIRGFHTYAFYTYITLLTSLRAAALHQRSAALTCLRVTWAWPGIALRLEAGP